MNDDWFPDRLARLRMIKGVSAREMSLSLGQSAGYINNIENGNSLPSMNTFFYMCDYLKITPKDFFDTEVRNPELSERVMADLKTLDDETLGHIAAIVKCLRR